MKKEEILNDPEFHKFVLREFEDTIQHALVEDLAVFAFGNIKEALKAFIKTDQNKVFLYGNKN